ncbi:MAG TPA: esterase [Candidatus Kapabacteria bacterium]|nr:esterase [Candidatus Kapabacteria bacterium]
MRLNTSVLVSSILATGIMASSLAAERVLQTTSGPIKQSAAGLILPHEHLFTDLRGPDTPGYGQADIADVKRVMLPLLRDAKEAGVQTLIECTSIGVGRNVHVVSALASESGMQVVVPTGVYGRANFAPKKYADATEDELVRLMMTEIVAGIDGTSVKAGFIKTASSDSELKPLEAKFLRASGRASLQTGVAVASHTTSGAIARKQLDILKELGVPEDRFVWVHANAEPDIEIHKELAKRGAYIELDSVNGKEADDAKILKIVQALIAAKCEDKILLSQDAGWYNPGQVNGGNQRGFTALAQSFIPQMKKAGLTEAQINKLTHENPFRAFSIPERPPLKNAK